MAGAGKSALQGCEWCEKKAVARVESPRAKKTEWTRYACGLAHLEKVYQLGRLDLGSTAKFETRLDDRGFALPARVPAERVEEAMA